MKKIIFMLLALTALYGCSKMEQISEQIPDENDSDLLIRLEGVINPVNPDSRAPVDGGAPAEPLGLIVLRAVADAVVVGEEVPTYNKGYASYVSDATLKTDGDIGWGATELRYPGDGKYTKLIGLYPNTGEVNLTAKTVTYAGFDGTQDIMCSGFLAGSKNDPITDRMAFSHILTQVQVYVQGEDASTIQEWGKVTSITISGKAGTVVVTMPNPQSGSDPTLELTSPSDLTVLNSTDSGVSFNNEEKTLCGVAMFLPVTNEALTFNVTTVDGTPKTLTTVRKTYAAATAYKITILFKNGGDVDISIGSGTEGSGENSIGSWIGGNGGGDEEVLPTS